MFRRQFLLIPFAAFLLFMVGLPTRSSAADDKDEIKVAGILFDRKVNYITVKGDGEEKPVTYMVPKDDTNLNEALQSVFGACRVSLTYKKDGKTRQLVSVKRQILKPAGTVTGTVVGVYDEFWIELKPNRGLNDAFAPGANWNDPAFVAWRKSLKPGDSITLGYTTDGERHRIHQYRTNESK